MPSSVEAARRKIDAGGVARPPSAAAWLACRPRLGTALIAATATVFASGSTVLRFAYDAGAGTLTIIATRTTVGVLAVGLLVALLRVPIRLTRREMIASPLIGVLMAAYSGAMYKGMETMPVALTVLTFYTYPLFTGLFTWLTGQERFGLAGAIALPMAFAGLLLALDVSGHGFNVAGAVWPLAGSVIFTVVLILSARLFDRDRDSRPRLVVMLGAASVSAILVSLLTGDVAFPTTPLGWAGLAGASLSYAVGMTSLLFVAQVFGAARVAVTMNVEPLASMVLTFFILGERLGPLQLVGAGFVIAAIFLFRPRRAAPQAAAVSD